MLPPDWIGQNFTDRIYVKQICLYFLKEHLISLQFMHFSVRTVFQSERLLNSFNMAISGMKKHFTPNV